MTIKLEAFILQLLQEKKVIHLQEIIKAINAAAGSSPERRTIQRALANLIKQELVEPKGKARARVYTLKTLVPSPIIAIDAFKDIPLSDNAKRLLQYLAKPIQVRPPVGYHQDFLRSYDPYQTPYLSVAHRTQLLTVGHVENGIHPAGTYARNILSRLLIDLSWNSSRLEGNTYSLLETKRLIEFGENAQGKDLVESQMILNHKNAIEYIVESADAANISSHHICNIHALLSDNLLGDPSAAGKIRVRSVGISGTTYLPLENPHVLKECFETFIKKMNLITDPFEQSFFSLVQLSYIQAFEDVNKRTARLVANIPLIKQNLNPLSFIDVSQEAYVKSLLGIYEKNDISLLRDLYLWAYKRSAQRYSAVQQAMGEPNLIKLKYRKYIQQIITTIILNKIPGHQLVTTIKHALINLNLPEPDATQLFATIETEISSLHDGNIARYKIRPSEFEAWRLLQQSPSQL